MELAKAVEKIEGEVDQIVHFNESTGFFIGVLLTGAKNAKVLGTSFDGNMPPIGCVMAATGTWENNKNPRFSEKIFRVRDYSLSMPKCGQGVVKLLTGLKGIGDVRAHKIIDRLGDKALEAIVANHECIIGLGGIGDAVAKRVSEELRALGSDADALKLLADIGLGPKVRNSIVDEFGGEKVVEMINENPYILVNMGKISFKKMDKFALATGRVAATSVRRGAAVVRETLRLHCEWGHTFASRDQIVKAAKALKLATPISDPRAIDAGIKYAIEQQAIVEVGHDRVALKDLAEAENTIASILTDWSSKPSKLGSLRILSEENTTLTAEQQQAVINAVNHRVSIITGGPGVGKCLAPGTPVLMYDGSIRPIEQIAINDTVMGDDSTPRRVIGLSHGFSNMYDVIPVKGMSFRVNENHIMTFKSYRRKIFGSGKNRCEVRGLGVETIDMPIQEFLSKPRRTQDRAKLFRVPVDFAPQDVPIDPYLLGLWLGDGDNHRAGFTSEDPEVVQFLEQYAESNGMYLSKDLDDVRANQYHLTTADKNSPNPVYQRPNPLYQKLRDLGLPYEKHIPHQFKCNSRSVRLSVLAGLLDTDGSVNGIGCYEIVSKYERLANDILYICRSLGFAAYVKTKIVPAYPDNIYYRVTISGNVCEIPVKIARKHNSKRQQIKNVLHTGFKIKDAGFGEYYGIAVDGNHRHLLGDFTVVHNTFVSRAVLEAMRGSTTFIVAPTGKAACRANQLTGCAASTIHRFIGRINSELDSKKEIQPDPDQVIPQVTLVDEASMVDTELFSRLLATLNLRSNPRLIVVGDSNQLPSIGPGRVLADLIESNTIPVVKLTQVQRQKGDSNIISNAYAINSAEVGEKFELREAADFVIVEHQKPEMLRKQILDYVIRLKNDGVDIINQMQVLSGQRKNTLGTHELNEAIRALVNPASPSKPEYKGKFGDSFRVGDKVMVTKNDYTLGVVNGDQGVVTMVQQADKDHKGSVTIQLTGINGTEVTFEDDDVEMLVQAWAITTHKSQGSEYPIALVVCHKQLEWALQRALLYTAVTRGKEKVVIFGTHEDINQAAVNETPMRYTRLGQMLYSNKSNREL